MSVLDTPRTYSRNLGQALRGAAVLTIALLAGCGPAVVVHSLAPGTATDAAVDDAVGQITPRRVSKRLPIEKSRLWKKTLQDSPNDAGLFFNLGAVSEALGSLQAAAGYYKEAIRLARTKEGYQAALKDLEGRLRDVRATSKKS